MRHLLVPTLAACAALAAPALAATTTFTGKATTRAGDFDYGDVTVKRAGDRVKRIEIESVTTTGCGGFMTLVFASGSKGSRILDGSTRIRNGRFAFSYQPVADADQATFYKGRFRGSKLTGTFESQGLCGNEGRFSARR